jgi:hypothetical protein
MKGVNKNPSLTGKPLPVGGKLHRCIDIISRISYRKHSERRVHPCEEVKEWTEGIS